MSNQRDPIDKVGSGVSCLTSSIVSAVPTLQERVLALQEAPSLASLVAAAWALARLITVQLVEEVLAQRARTSTQWGHCPECGVRLQSKGRVPRQVFTLIGPVRYVRCLGRCPHRCEIGQVVPFDEELGLEPGQRASWELKEAACALSVFVPYSVATVLLELLTGVEVSPGAVWLWVQEAGKKATKELEDTLTASDRGMAPDSEVTPELAALPLVVGADGVMAPFRPQPGTPKGRTSWREVKVAVLARFKQHTSRNGNTYQRLVQRRVVAVLGSIDALKPRIQREALRQGVELARSVAWVADGGSGLWRLFEDLFRVPYGSKAQGILDFFHAAENLAKAGQAWLDGRTVAYRNWLSSARHKLRHGQPNAVLADIAAALQEPGLPEPARKHLRNLYDYLDKHREHINYERFRELGLPLGSGMVESACKWLIQQRFKGTGMRWSQDGFSHLLHLRLAWANGRFRYLFLSPSS